MTSDAIDLLEKLIRSDDVGIEFGSGRSTVWFCERVGYLFSVETDPAWYEWTRQALLSKNLNNFTFECVSMEEVEKTPEKYVNFFIKYRDNSFDFALIDGKLRAEATKTVLKKIKVGGLLIIDNINRYIPTETKAPASIGMLGVPSSNLWAEIYAELASWRCLHTSNGVCDTNIYIKQSKDSCV